MADISDREIISILGGPAAVARMVKVRPPSVQGWMVGGIPEGRLIELAAEIERRDPTRFSRRERWPDRCGFIWPDLCTTVEGASDKPPTEIAANDAAPQEQPATAQGA